MPDGPASKRGALRRGGSGYRETVPTEPSPVTLFEVVKRAVEICDPAGEDEALADFLRRFEDRDEPITAVENLEDETLEEARWVDPEGDDPALAMAAAVTTYLGFKRDALGAPDDQLLRLAARSEFDGHPPPAVADWLRARGVEA
jgi:hypothetical protein